MRCVQIAVGSVCGNQYSLCFEYDTFKKRADLRVQSISTTALCDFSFENNDDFLHFQHSKLREFEQFCLGFPYEKI